MSRSVAARPVLAETELEVQLTESLAARQVPEAPAVEKRPERGLDGGAQTCDERLCGHRPRVPAQPVLHAGAQLLLEIDRREVDPLEHFVDKRAELGPSGHLSERQIGDSPVVGRLDDGGAFGRVGVLVGRPRIAESLVARVELIVGRLAADGAEGPPPPAPVGRASP